MNTIKEVYTFAAKGKRYMFWSVFLQGASSIFGILPYYASYRIIAKLFNHSGSALFFLEMALLILIGMTMKTILGELGLKVSHQLAYETLAGMRKYAANQLLRMPLGTTEKWGSASLKKVFVENIEEMEVVLAHGLPEGLGNIIGLTITVLAIFVLDWRMALVSLAVMPIGYIAIILMSMNSKKKLEEFYNASRNMNNTIIEFVRGMKEIKVFGQGDNAFARYKKSVEEYKDYSLNWYKTSWKYMSFYEVVLPTTLLFLLPAGILFYSDGSLSLAAFIACVMLALSIGPMLIRVVFFIPLIPNLKQKFKPIKQLFSEQVLKEKNDLYLVPRQYDVEFDSVIFGYGKQSVLNNVSFCAKQGSVTAIVGKSGAGKSTVAKLLCRFWDVDKGTIRIGGQDIRDIPFQSLMEIVSFVAQDNFLFDMSIMDNIRLGRPDATDEEVIAVAKAARCDDFIQELPKGYATLAGEAGGKLSGGQRQRITIARAILKDSPIVILDEATSSTDAENEDLIQEALNHLLHGKTVLVIAHRLSTIVEASRIVVIKEGEIYGQGTHNDLLNSCDEYRHMWEKYNTTANWGYNADSSAQEVVHNA